eukprot:9110013-Alexandrium_andersonii.AAC.1
MAKASRLSPSATATARPACPSSLLPSTLDLSTRGPRASCMPLHAAAPTSVTSSSPADEGENPPPP